MNYRRNEDQLCINRNPPAYSGCVGDPVFSAEDTTEPVTLAEAKAYLRIDASETFFDAEITELISAVRLDIETYLNKSLIHRTITVTMNIAEGQASLPYGPVIELSAATDRDGNTIDAGDYDIKAGVLKTYSYDLLTLTYTAGYTVVPAAMKLGIKRLIAFDWENKGDTGKERKLGAITGLAKYRSVV